MTFKKMQDTKPIIKRIYSAGKAKQKLVCIPARSLLAAGDYVKISKVNLEDSTLEKQN